MFAIRLYVYYTSLCLLFLSCFSETRFLSTNLRNIRFIEIPSSGNQIFFYAEELTEGRTNMTKLIVAFRSSADVPQNYILSK
jgi:hypothetical protein